MFPDITDIPDFQDLRALELGGSSLLSPDPNKQFQPADNSTNANITNVSAAISSASAQACDNQAAVMDSGLREDRR